MNKELSSQYNSKEIEDNIYKLWEDSGYFNPDNLPARHKKPFTIIMPPPNANGSLHIGHALFVTLEDIMIRYQRMQGRKTLWLPGADHAGFETQVVYHKKMEKEGRSLWEMPREQLYNEIKDFTLANKKYMEGQLKKLGASCDWSREKFTLDESIKEVVNETFEKLYNDGLVYRAEKPVNWCTKHQTTLSDLEIGHEERADKLYYIKYKLSDSDEYIEVATTRPETIPADIAVAVHPKSKWAKYIDKKLINPLTKKEVPVLSDMIVDLTFGTGALKITPFHDPIDFLVWINHKKEIDIQPFSVINQYGKMTEQAGPELAGLKVKEAREKSVELLRPNLVKEPEDYKHQVSVCYKCNTAIEPRIMMQWFVKMTEKPIKGKSSLRDLAVSAVKSKKIKFIPSRFEKVYMHWMKNVHDWNISRQIVWGIQIPAWYCMFCNDIKINPKIKSRWFIVRHGETNWNKEGRSMGHKDIPLNELGKKQALETAQKLENNKIDLIISSDLLRAKETAEIIAKHLGVELIIDKELREKNGGVIEGLTKQEREEKFGKDALEKWRIYDNKPENGESWKEFEERVIKAFKNHKSAHHHKNIVIVTHGGTIGLIEKNLKNLQLDDVFSKNAIINGGIFELVSTKEECKKCGNDFFEQETDVFDTWFSSGQWPYATLMTGKPDDFKKYYPTDVMETGWDILFFWVARMIMFGLYRTGKIPFKDVYLHGLIRDKDRQKMSKSKGNVINPLEMAETYGTDAVRMALIIGSTAGNDPIISEDKIRGYRNFATKIWNASRFVLMNYKKIDTKPKLTAADKKNLKDLENIKKKITKYLDKYDFNHAGETAYHYFWHTFADKVIEQSKSRINPVRNSSPIGPLGASNAGVISNGVNSENLADAAAAQETLIKILRESLKFLHPFMPFITEQIFKMLPTTKEGSLLMIEKW